MFLTERQKRILLAIVRKYMDDGEPVSSGFVTSQLGNDLSSATIRNEMAELSSMGYLQQPHVSAGRVPTVLAYHMYISAFLVEATRHRMFTGPMDLPLRYESLPRLFDGVATAVSDRTKKVSFVLSPPINSVTLRHVSLVPFSETVLMLVFITDRESVEGYKLLAPADTTEQELADINAIFARELRGKSLEEGIHTLRFGNMLPQDFALRYGGVLDAVAQLMEGELRKGESQIFVRGIEQMLSELPDDQVAAFSTLSTFLSREEVVKPYLNSLSDRGEISLFIGEENQREELRSFSLVSVSYSLDSNQRGVLGLVGPIRMNYIRAITVLESFAGYLGRVSGSG
ncbi:heat-inducible transcriptional repressor HrcA [Candidatus Cryosericum septentrionale]|jgi:heat-inducible transcriptional repressor|uniref:Heat-inducible transcription repressor HrcA n=1 Tax=Candidatus Cryosericum septentrionale TaxID=2290913 RepID=A0A398E4S5_9BACT|nr:heat-inducible transcriptional repressor HrcA [Candidatus Cryosericum septentrionale]RIE17621.1 heat-inducible transcription repressor HrcA [Candidatus Cryosericum septentrionale]